MLTRLWYAYRIIGPRHFLPLALRRVTGARARCHELCLDRIRGKSGLELGGPSTQFDRRGLLPLYDAVASLDNVNFGNRTLWEGDLSDGTPFRAGGRTTGRQFIAEATHLPDVADESYDFVLSCHMLEHTANPLKALHEWRRVLRPGGTFVLMLPHRDGTFDHRRPVTTLEHIRADFEADRGEDDLTHLPEVLALHDRRRDPYAGDRDAFVQRSSENLKHRALHHHVFDADLVARMLDAAQFQLIAVESQRPNHVIAVAAKPQNGTQVDNQDFLSERAGYRRISPFPSDRARIGSQ